jgi:3-deoxy-D-manno-octulosonate 8-phosphate phosphatase (KDO 8-P phosphatase)
MSPIKLLLLDVDGILTDGKLWYDQHGEALKCFHVHDGHGLKELMRNGIQVGIISGRDCPALRARLSDLGITTAFLGVDNKLPCYEKIKSKQGLQDSEIAYMGDDIPDLAIMQQVALAITVPNAAAQVKAVAHRVTKRHGGCGAVREACDHLLQPEEDT